jgi:cytochrome c-type biogenesis protein CcmH/NrfF
VVALLLAALLGGQQAVASDHFNPSEVFRELRCPTCETSLDVSNAPVARRMKEFVLVRWRQGWSEERVIDALVVEFGEDVRTTPQKSGFGLVTWLVPIFVGLLAVLILVVVVRLWVRRRRLSGGEETSDVPAADSARVDRELERLGDL